MNFNKKATNKPLSDPKKTQMLEEINARNQAAERGILRTFCKKCDAEMNKVMTVRHVFYRCANYPSCDVNADPKLIAEVVLDSPFSRDEYGSIRSFYQYDEEKNIVFVSFEKA